MRIKKRTVLNDYDLHRRGAGYRGIVFDLTFKQWLLIWQQSGHFTERGRRGHQYVMARYEDKGAYTVGNVKIITQSENLSEGHMGMVFSKASRRGMSASHRGKNSAVTRRKISKALRGQTKSAEHRRKLSAATKKAWKDGLFAKRKKKGSP